ncbi:MAG: hypothetical protein K0Q91_982 [Fibrobacteria bacterium]|jgi:hypothetical protein|nr:hypothetical protein [Fibrobacteria bacterium]
MSGFSRLFSVLGALFLVGCLPGPDDPKPDYGPVTELSGSWGERPGDAFAFAGRIDTFQVSGTSVRMFSRVWSDVIPCVRDTLVDSMICVRPPEREYYRGRSSLTDTLLTFRLVRCDSAFSPVSEDTLEFSWIAEGYNSGNGKLKLRRNGISREFDPVCPANFSCSHGSP